jgi:uncharacterized membrane protein YheB (UPF0754 family)
MENEARIFKIIASLISIEEHSGAKLISNFEASSYLYYMMQMKSISLEDSRDFIDKLIDKMEQSGDGVHIYISKYFLSKDLHDKLDKILGKDRFQKLIIDDLAS